MREQAGRAPEQLHAGALLLFLEDLDDGIEVAVGLPQVLAFRRDVAVVEGIEGGTELFEEFEGDPHARLSHLDGVGAVLPRANGGADAEHVTKLAANSVPVGDGEAEMVLHRLPGDKFLGVVVLEGERVLGARPFVLDLGDGRKVCFGLLVHDAENFTGKASDLSLARQARTWKASICPNP